MINILVGGEWGISEDPQLQTFSGKHLKGATGSGTTAAAVHTTKRKYQKSSVLFERRKYNTHRQNYR